MLRSVLDAAGRSMHALFHTSQSSTSRKDTAPCNVVMHTSRKCSQLGQSRLMVSASLTNCSRKPGDSHCARHSPEVTLMKVHDIVLARHKVTASQRPQGEIARECGRSRRLEARST